jgi:hypothetical protein
MNSKKNMPFLFACAMLLIATSSWAQLTPITFEPAGYGYNWTWTVFENATNPATSIVANPNAIGLNTSSSVIKFTALQAGQPWAGFESSHGAGIGVFTLNATNSIVRLMVYKSVISDVGVKFATASGASTGELKVPNTLVNQWEELVFDFSTQIGNPVNTNIDQIIIFPDFNARSADNICYVDNISLGTTVPQPTVNVKFGVNGSDSLPVYLFGNWNNWSNFPGTPMAINLASGIYEATVPLTAGSSIEYLYVNGIGTKETLNPTWTCTNGNGQYTNRTLTVANADMDVCNLWKSCNPCNPLSVAVAGEKSITIRSSGASLMLSGLQDATIDAVRILDLTGRTVYAGYLVPIDLPLPVQLMQGTAYYVHTKHRGVTTLQRFNL